MNTQTQTVYIVLVIIGLALQVIIAGTIVIGFVWRIPSKGDLKRVEEKTDNANKQIEQLQGGITLLTDRVQKLEGFFGNPPLYIIRVTVY